MKILQTSKSGQVTQAIKSKEELTNQEIEKFKKFDSLNDYSTFTVHYNKKGELKKVNGYDFTEQKKEEIKKGAKEADIYFTKVAALFAPNKNDRKKAYQKLERDYGICI